MRKVVGDLEANGFLDVADTIWCGVFKDIATKEVFKFLPHQMQEMTEFLNTCGTLIMHNGIGYDIPLMEKVLGYQYPGGVWDSLVVSRLQKPKRLKPAALIGKTVGPHSVEAWGARFGRPKPEHEEWDRFSPEMLHRCSEDVEIQEMIYYALLEEGAGMNWDRARQTSFKFFHLMQKQEEYGWKLDIERVEAGIKLLDHWIRKIDEAVVPKIPKIREVADERQWHELPFTRGGDHKKHARDWMDRVGMDYLTLGGSFRPVLYRDIDLSKQKEVKDYLLAEGWEPADWNTSKETGERTSPVLNHEDPFVGLEGAAPRLIAKRVQIVHRRGILTGWLRDVGPDGRLRQVISGIATTGRLRHSVIVNVPGNDKFFGPYLRKCLCAKEGFVIIGTDSAACQNRMLAARVGDDEFTEIILNGDKDKGTAIHQVNQKNIKEIAGYEVSYKDSKNLNYAFLFGATDPKLGRMVGRDEGAGGKIREALLAVAPGFQELVDSITAEWKANASVRINKFGKPEFWNGWIRGVDGRPIFIESERTLLVYLLQSDEAILMQYALLFLYKWCTDKGWKLNEDYGFVANVHDEYQAEVRQDIAEEFAGLAEQSIAVAGRYLKIACPHIGESDIGQNWYETH